MKSKNIIIKKKEGLRFAKLSGDKNRIHLDNLTGYNSQFGENIIHGSFILIKFLNEHDFEGYNSIKINFHNGFYYNTPIRIKKNKSHKNTDIFKLTQNNETKGVIEFSKKKSEIFFKLEKKTFYKKFIVTRRIKKLFVNKKIDNELNLSLNFLTKYVGMIYPGNYSLISEIKIKRNDIIDFDDVKIYSWKPSSRHPIIYNNLYYKKFEISFQTLIRPKLLVKNIKKTTSLIKSIHQTNKNILIIGASKGIGSELFHLFKQKKNKKIIATYYKNTIVNVKKNILCKKINIEKDLNKIFSLIKTYRPLIVYYFPTPKIDLKASSNKQLKIYKKFYTTIPIKIIKYCIKNKSYFFYPSSTYIDKIQKNYYTYYKNHAEKEINKIKDNKLFVNILRIPEINTKQNLSVFNRDLPSFTELLNKDKNFRNMIFFKNLI